MPKTGMISASCFNSCLTKDVGKVVLKQCYRIACERIGVADLEEQYDISYIRSVEWGIEHEPLAVAEYEARNMCEVHSRQTWRQIPGRMVGGTPDGLIGNDGIVEIKCPDSINHMLNIAESGQLSQYAPQIQAYLWICEREWLDFNSFDPRFPEELQLHTQRVYRDEGMIKRIDSRAAEMEEIVQNTIESLRKNLGFVVSPEFEVAYVAAAPPGNNARDLKAAADALYGGPSVNSKPKLI